MRHTVDAEIRQILGKSQLSAKNDRRNVTGSKPAIYVTPQLREFRR